MATEAYNRRFNRMSLTALRKVAKEEYGLSGLSKAPREIVQAAINQARQAKPKDNVARMDAYYAQSNYTRRLTARQLRQLRRMERRGR